MDERSKLAREVLIAGLLLGVLGDALLRAGPWSINFTMWVVTVVVVTLLMAARHRIDWPNDTIWLVVPVILFALAFSWRDSDSLKFFNFLAIAVAVSVWSMRTERVRVPFRSILDYVRGAVNVGISAMMGAAPLVDREVSLTANVSSAKWKHARAAALGVVIALPLLFVFGGLLMAADAVFDQMISTAFDFDLEQLASHVFLAGFFAWIVCGFLLLVLGFNRPRLGESIAPERPALGIVEVTVPLALINLLFIAFVVVQLRYLFGDASLVEETVGLTYSEYARRGFFELVAVTALVLPLLLAADWQLADAGPKSTRVFRSLAGVTLLLLFVIVASALKRMNLYQSVYGLTEQRLYTTAFMTWLGITLIWFAATVLSGRRRYFATGAVMAGFCLVAAMNLVNPDALIARINTERAAEGKEFDALYAASLSADAVPILLGAFESLGRDDRSVIAGRLLNRWSAQSGRDWRTWNAGRARAERAIAGVRPRLEAEAAAVYPFWSPS